MLHRRHLTGLDEIGRIPALRHDGYTKIEVQLHGRLQLIAPDGSPRSRLVGIERQNYPVSETALNDNRLPASSHDHDIPLERILDIVLSAKPAGIVFEAANPRHRHEWVVWRDASIPDDKILIPGCIDSTYSYVEHPELVAQQICQFAEIVGPERVIAGTDCGFGTFVGTGRVVPDIVYKKLAALVEGAAIASKRLGLT